MNASDAMRAGMLMFVMVSAAGNEPTMGGQRFWRPGGSERVDVNVFRIVVFGDYGAPTSIPVSAAPRHVWGEAG